MNKITFRNNVWVRQKAPFTAWVTAAASGTYILMQIITIVMNGISSHNATLAFIVFFDDSDRSNQSYLEAGDYYIAAAAYGSDKGFVFVPKDYTDDGGHTFIAVRYHTDKDPSGDCIRTVLNAVRDYTGIAEFEALLAPYLE